MTGLRFRRARAEAKRLLRRLGLERERPIPVEGIAGALDVSIVPGNLSGALAFLSRGRRTRIRVADSHSSPVEQRFSIAHELGHFVLDHPTSLDLSSDANIARAFQDRDKEREANTFAAEVLMPSAAVRASGWRFPADFRSMADVAREFGVNAVAAAIRLAELATEPCALVFIQGRQIRWVVRSGTFPVRLRINRALAEGSVAARCMRTGRQTDEHDQVEARAWFGGDVGRSLRVTEHTIPLARGRTCLSLISISRSDFVEIRAA